MTLTDHPAYHTEPVGAPYRFGRWHKDRLTLSGYRLELIEEIKARLRGQNRRKFLILARARSGTTLLVNLLRQTPTMRCDGEVLHFAVRNPRRFLNNLVSTTQRPACGAKLLSYQIIEVQCMREPIKFFDSLQKDGFCFIHLVRDTFEQCVSLSIAQAQSIYFVKSGSDQDGPKRMQLDPAHFVKQVRWNMTLLDLERRIMDRFDHLSLDYAHDLQDASMHQKTVDRIAAYIGVQSGSVHANSRKAIRERYEDMIENYDEVVHALDSAGLDALLPKDR